MDIRFEFKQWKERRECTKPLKFEWNVAIWVVDVSPTPALCRREGKMGRAAHTCARRHLAAGCADLAFSDCVLHRVRIGKIASCGSEGENEHRAAPSLPGGRDECRAAHIFAKQRLGSSQCSAPLKTVSVQGCQPEKSAGWKVALFYSTS